MTIPLEESPRLPRGEYFHHQLLGLRVVGENGEELGSITEILQTGSNDVYLVSGAGKDILLPAIRDVIREVDLAQGVMRVRLMDGLL